MLPFYFVFFFNSLCEQCTIQNSEFPISYFALEICLNGNNHEAWILCRKIVEYGACSLHLCSSSQTNSSTTMLIWCSIWSVYYVIQFSNAFLDSLQKLTHRQVNNIYMTLGLKSSHLDWELNWFSFWLDLYNISQLELSDWMTSGKL